jgi:hypothetical protein
MFVYFLKVYECVVRVFSGIYRMVNFNNYLQNGNVFVLQLVLTAQHVLNQLTYKVSAGDKRRFRFV